MTRLAAFLIVFAFIICFSRAAAAQVEQINKNTSPVGKTESAKEFYASLKGDWKGSYSLWMRPGAPAQESNINARFQETAKGNYFLMTYTWSKAGETHDGIFLFGGDGILATATWGDSFHMSPEPMQCKGELMEGGKKLVVTGSYPANEGPDWGWRTEFTLETPDSLLMEAYNIMPDGVEALAVKADLKRVGKKN